MGGWFAKLFEYPTEKKLVMLGLDGAGKTTILYKMKLGEVVTSVPTIGFNVEAVSYKNLQMNIWDVGGQNRIRQLWNHYYEKSDGLVFVVDSADSVRLSEAASEIEKLHRESSLRNIPFLIFANKQDLQQAVPVSKMNLGLTEMYNRNWKIQSCSATTGDGIYEGFEWLHAQLTKK